ncbi:hypothetical protein HPB47_004409 [Ixodes persulcatus]|uniref:Uncharacterized protein n=1 Tax=Ixodes persulcatus TaxID=34615 RepID=A0AC60PGY7_IXOPE|nr:hypothetical protein HPB47_004409 [Ixodes persulcatus]
MEKESGIAAQRRRRAEKLNSSDPEAFVVRAAGAGKKDTSVPPARPLGATGAACLVIPPLAARRPAFAVVMSMLQPTARSARLTRMPRFCPAALRPFPRSPPPFLVPLVRRTNLETTPLAPQSYDHPAPSSPEAPSTRVPEAFLPTAGTQDAPGVDDDFLSSGSDRLVIAGQANVTPAQGHPVPKPTLPTSSPTCESSTNPSSSAAPHALSVPKKRRGLLPDDSDISDHLQSPELHMEDSDSSDPLGFHSCQQRAVFRKGSISVYPPTRPSASHPFFKSLLQYVPSDGFFFPCGDFNCVLDSNRNVRGPGRGRGIWNARELARLLGLHNLRDAWLELHGALYAPTWSRGPSSSRLDRVYLSPGLVPRVLRCAVLSFPVAAGYVSDRLPVSVVLDLSSFLHPRLSSLRQSIRMSLSAAPLSPSRWEVIKSDCRFYPTTAGKLLRRRVTEVLNETIRRTRIVQRGGTRTYLMSEYLALLRDRYQRLVHSSSRPTVAQQLRGQPVDDTEVLQCLRASRTGRDCVTVSAYADDVGLFIRDSESLEAAMRISF